MSYSLEVHVLCSLITWSVEKQCIFIIKAGYWLHQRDECSNILSLTCAKWQLHLRPSPAVGGHRGSPHSCHGNGKQEGNFSWAPNSDTLLRLRQTQLSCTSSVKAGVRSCCLFNFLTSHKSGQSTPLFFTLPLLRSFSYVETYFHAYPCGRLLSHILCLHHSTLWFSHTIYIPAIWNSKAQVQPCLCVRKWDGICYFSSPTAVTQCNYCTYIVNPLTAQSDSRGYRTCLSNKHTNILFISGLSRKY